MVKKLFRYKLNSREGLIVQNGDLFGEIAPLPGFSIESLEDAEKEARLWMDTGQKPTLPSVQFGIACAHRPLRSIYLPLCALGPKKGYPAIKLKLGHLSVPEAIEKVQKRPTGILRLDCNARWTLDQALEFVSHFKPTDFAYIEDPTEDVAKFSKKSGFPVAVDQLVGLDWSQIPTLKAIVVKPTLRGTIPKVPPHIDLVLSSSYESGLGLLHIANLASNHLPIGLDTVFEDDLLINPIRSSNGIFSWEKKEPILNMEKLCRVH